MSHGILDSLPAEVLRGVFAISSEAIVVTDSHRRILMFSVGAEAIFGYPSDEVIGQTVERLMPERFRTAHPRHVAQFAAEPRQSMPMRERGQVVGRRKSGEEFLVEASLSKVLTPDGLLFTTIIRDVTSRRQRLDRIVRSEERLNIAIQSADLHVFEVDFVNETIFKAGSEDVFFERPLTYDDVARNIWCGVRPDYRPLAKAAWRRHRRTGETFRFEGPVARRDGREVWAAFTAELIADPDGRSLRLIGAIQDVTARRAATTAMAEAVAAAEAANEAKSTFLATMSHEIRTPLNGVLGMAQAMAREPLSAQQQERLDVIRQSGEALLAILNDVLDLSKIEAGRLDLEEIAFDLGDLVRGAQATFTTLANKKGLSFSLNIDPAIGVFVGDPTRVRQILYNLLSNALKFTDTGEVRVEAAYDGAYLELQVIDSGIGMSKETMAHLFAPFSQADSSMTRRFGGTGLGLAISRQLAARMGGEISAKSEPGFGSTFTVRLPLTRVSDSAAVRSEDSPQPAGASAVVSRPIRILVAEDNPTNQLVLKTLLHQVGLDPVVVDNGQKAVEAWRAEAFDLILMDIQMPELSGPAATRVIRSEESARSRPAVPIIALTANAMAHQVAAYLDGGMNAVVTKPINVADLFRTIDQVLVDESE